MKFETVLPFIKIGAGLILAGAAGSAATTAYQKQTPKEPEVKCVCNCNHPPIRGELLFPKK